MKKAYCEGNGKLAWEAVSHFGEMFLPENYPDFEVIRDSVSERHDRHAQQLDQTDDRLALVAIVSELFDQLGYDVPATFYWTFLHPLERANLFEVRSFRFSEQDLAIARQFDAILHGGYVSCCDG
ncbi:MAG: hypothetical protein HC895_20345 [Leptolyngbyaceae cyanobacterium SM1_3_5]|nr:hypothetical protein [Leptolyngbyaceae cyanobacterium SM1_3_5]